MTTEFCRNGHERTEENTSWVRDSSRGRVRKRCLDCRRGAYQPVPGTNAAEASVLITNDKHEDLEDLLRFGATFEEIMARGGFASWSGMVRSLRRRGREDLIDLMAHRRTLGGDNRYLVALPNAKKKRQGRRQFRHGDVHDLPKELEDLIY